MIDVAMRAAGAIGTRFAHQGRTPGLGLDCLGLVLFALDRPDWDERDYPEIPDSSRLADALVRCMDPAAIARIEDVPAGFVVAFSSGARRRVRHLAIRSSGGIIHAVRHFGVVETPLVDPWRGQFAGAYRWRN